MDTYEKKGIEFSQIFIRNPWQWNRPITYLSWIIRQAIASICDIEDALGNKITPNHSVVVVTYHDGTRKVCDFTTRYKCRDERVWLEEDLNRQLSREYPLNTTRSENEIMFEVDNATSIYKGYEYRKLINYLFYVIQLKRSKKQYFYVPFPENSKRNVCFEWNGNLKGLGKNNYALPNDLIS